MDLQDFEAQQLYFDKPTSDQVNQLIQQAAEHYAEGGAEDFLLKAYDLEPDSLLVLVALYRFYYYQHRLDDAIKIAFEAMAVTARLIDFPEHWSEITSNHLAMGVYTSFTMVRFYLLALKGCAYLHLRLNRLDTGVKMLNKVIEMDSKDRLGAKELLRAMGPANVVDNTRSVKQAVAAGV